MADRKSDEDFWARRPEDGLEKRRYDVIRVGAGRSIKGIMLAGDVIGAYTHWFGGRTVPCFGPECRACATGVEIRWHGYVPLMAIKQRTIQIFELTVAAVGPLDAWFRTHRSLRGALVELQRRGGRANGMVRSLVSDGPLPAEALPDPPDVKAVLRNLWSLREDVGVLTNDRYTQKPVKPFPITKPNQTVIPGADTLGGRLHEGNGHDHVD